MLAIFVSTVTSHGRAVPVDALVRVLLAIKATDRLSGLQVRVAASPCAWMHSLSTHVQAHPGSPPPPPAPDTPPTHSA